MARLNPEAPLQILLFDDSRDQNPSVTDFRQRLVIHFSRVAEILPYKPQPRE